MWWHEIKNYDYYKETWLQTWNYKSHDYKLEIIWDMVKNLKCDYGRHDRYGYKLEIIRDMVTNLKL